MLDAKAVREEQVPASSIAWPCMKKLKIDPSWMETPPLLPAVHPIQAEDDTRRWPTVELDLSVGCATDQPVFPAEQELLPLPPQLSAPNFESGFQPDLVVF